MDLAVADLLEQEEKKHLERKAAAERHDSSHRDDSERHHGRGSSKYKTDGDRYDGERGSPSVRSTGRGSADGSRSVRSRDGLRNDDDDAQSANGGSRRRRSRSPRHRTNEYSRSDRHRDRSRDRHPRRGDDHHYRPSGTSRREDDRDYYHSNRNDRYERDGYHDRDRRPRESRTAEVKKQSVAVASDDERDRRTVFVQQLAGHLRSKDFKRFFEQVGAVRDVQIVKDRVSQKSKGVGYVEFENEESVEKALNLTGHKLMDIPVIVQRTEAEKNRQAKAEPQSSASNGQPFHRLYVGNIHFSVSEDDLRTVFESFGALDFVQLQKDEHNRSKGFGFVQYTDASEAKEALEKMQGFEIAGRQIRVGLGTDRYTADSAQTMQQRLGGPQMGSSFSGLGGRGQHAGGSANFDRAGARDAEKTGGASALDDNDVAGVNFSNYSRDSLMRKLARVEDSEKKDTPLAKQTTKSVVEPVTATRCILLKNMWTTDDTNEPGWQKELEDDVGEECNKKYGIVLHIGVDSSTVGDMYVKFDRVQGGENAYRGLNGRFFGGQVITANYIVDAVYNAHFPKAAGL